MKSTLVLLFFLSHLTGVTQENYEIQVYAS
jgi:hypothetical protein